MKQVFGRIYDFDIVRNENGQYFIDDGEICGVVYFPSLKALRSLSESFGQVPNGRHSGACAACPVYHQLQFPAGKESCSGWKAELLAGVTSHLIPIAVEGDLYGKDSYIDKVVTIAKSGKMKRDRVPIEKTFYGSDTFCKLRIYAQLIEVGDYLAVKLLYGRAVKGKFKDDDGAEVKIKEHYYRVETDPRSYESFLDALTPISYDDLKRSFVTI